MICCLALTCPLPAMVPRRSHLTTNAAAHRSRIDMDAGPDRVDAAMHRVRDAW